MISCQECICWCNYICINVDSLNHGKKMRALDYCEEFISERDLDDGK